MPKSRAGVSHKLVNTVGESFISCINYSNLFAIKLMIDNNIITPNQINGIMNEHVYRISQLEIVDYLVDNFLDHLEKNILNDLLSVYIESNWISSNVLQLIDSGASIGKINRRQYSFDTLAYILENRIDHIDIDTLNHCLLIYIDKKMPVDKINFLIDSGAQLTSVDMIYFVKLPDSMFFEHINNMAYEINNDLILACLNDRSINKIKYFCNLTDFDNDSYIDFLSDSIEENDDVIYDYFAQSVSDNIVFYIVLLDNMSSFSNYPTQQCTEKFAKQVRFIQKILAKITLTDSMLLHICLNGDNDNKCADMVKQMYTNFNWYTNYSAYLEATGHSELVSEVSCICSRDYTVETIKIILEKCDYLLTKVDFLA